VTGRPRVLFVTPELAPFARVGGLGEVAGSLPRALGALGSRVDVVVPLYGIVDRAAFGLEPAGMDLEIRFDGRLRRSELWRARNPRNPGYDVHFISSEDYFERRSVYGDDSGDYADNALRFAYFSMAALEAARVLGVEPDIVHVHDWPTALVPLYLRHGASAGSPKPVVLTVHNLAYQGVYPASVLERVGLPGSLFRVDGLEFYGQVNFLKGGLLASEAITTVSPSYAREILTSSHGAGLEGVLRERSRDLVGILNGIDHSVWDPAHDPALAVSFDSRRPAGKTENKLQLQKELGLTISAETPLLAAIGRLDAQKGFDLLLEAAPRLFRAGAQLVVLGSGNSELLRAFEELRARDPASLAAARGFRDDLGRRIYASSDLFLMPSRYEPCGLGQLVAMRYGSLPVVRSTGGLADTVRDLDADPDGGNGFVFEELSAPALAQAVERAISHFRAGSGRWQKWVVRAMEEDFSWEKSAALYIEVYRRASRGRR
jgi:starch synthase